jgi:hypothetical protein
MSFKIIVEDQVFSSIEEFARNIYLYPDASEKVLTSTKFLSLLYKEDKDKFNQLIKCNHEIKDVDEFLFHAQYILCPHMELRHHGYKFDNLEDLGKKILNFGPQVDIYLKDFLKFKLLSKFMLEQGINEKEPKIYDKVVELEKKFEENENKSYFLLGFALAKCNTIIYERQSFTDVKEFFSQMTSSANLTKFSSLLETSQYVYAWLEVKGYGGVTNNYRSLIETIEQLEQDTYDRRN